MQKKFDFVIIFDVDFNYSLDKLKDELEHLVTISETTVHINPWGPAGGNTQVTVMTDNADDANAVEAYLKLHDL